jgi:hypothetical protein
MQLKVLLIIIKICNGLKAIRPFKQDEVTKVPELEESVVTNNVVEEEALVPEIENNDPPVENQ